jgi:hypothetical protein
VRALVALLLGTVPLIGVATSAHGADSGALTWGFKASWRNYVATIAAGTTSLSDGAGSNSSGEYVFPQESTDLTSQDDTGVTKYEGSVRWQSSAHGFDITMSDPWLDVTSSDEAVLTAVLTDNAGNSRGRIEIATVELDDSEVDDDSLTWTDRPTEISEDAAETFTNYANASGDPLDAVVHEEGIGEDDEPDPEPTPTPTPTPTTVPEPAPDDPELAWGLKESFRSYITGSIAKGHVTSSDGARTRSGIYVWDQRSASVGSSAQGSANYGGSIRFRGHEHAETPGQYALDLELKDPEIAVSSASSATLSFHVIDRAEGATTDHGRIDFAKVSLSGASVCGSAGYRAWSGASTTITADGADVMNNYPEGTALDRLSFSVEDSDLSASGVRACTADDDPDGGSGGGGGKTPTPGATTSPDDDVTSKTAGKLTWGVKESFRSYIVGSIAKGSVRVSDGAKTSGDAYQWGQESTATTNGIGTTDYFGSVRFTGHGGELDMDFSDPRVDVDSTSSGSISFLIDGSRVEMVDLDLAEGTRKITDGVVRWTGVPATLTSAGAKAFDGYYDRGTTMDRVSFIIGSRASADSDDEEVDSHSSSSTTVAPTSLTADEEDTDAASKCPLTRANLSWGFKESFRSYISGSIANGDWNVADGASYETPSFGWTQASGNATAPTKAAVNFTGTVRFTGHNGALNTTIANPSLLIADDKATLKLDVSGASRDAAMSGNTETQAFPDIAFAAIDLSGIKRDGNTWSATSAPTALTSSGHAAFDSYEAGTALDPVTFSVTFEDCLDKAGQRGGGPAAIARQAVSNALAGFEFEPWMASMLAAAGGTGIALAGDRLIRKVRSRR